MCGVSDNELVQGVHIVECTRVQSTLTLSCTDHQCGVYSNTCVVC